MIIEWEEGVNIRETEKAVLVPLTVDEETKMVWIPKSQIKNNLKPGFTMIDIPDWLHQSKIDECF